MPVRRLPPPSPLELTVEFNQTRWDINYERAMKSGNQKALVLEQIIKQGKRCAITDIPFVYEQNNPHAPSIDRLDDTKGYVEGNIQIVIQPVNTRIKPPIAQYRELIQKYFR
jgi:hypothetical protein